jgi:hypothetical protein
MVGRVLLPSGAERGLLITGHAVPSFRSIDDLHCEGVRNAFKV